MQNGGARSVWLRSVGAFIGASFRPVRRLNGWAQEAGVPFAGLIVFVAIGASAGWLWGALALASMLAILFLLEGTRTEYARRNISLTFVAHPPEPLAGNVWKLAVAVTNQGRAKTFVPRCSGLVDGLHVGTQAGDFTFPWEGKFRRGADPASGLARGDPDWIPGCGWTANSISRSRQRFTAERSLRA